jgi:hypothetical protein
MEQIWKICTVGLHKRDAPSKKESQKRGRENCCAMHHVSRNFNKGYQGFELKPEREGERKRKGRCWGSYAKL